MILPKPDCAQIVPVKVNYFQIVPNETKRMNNRIYPPKEFDDMTKLIVPMLSNGGVIESSVFGSFARGEVKSDSDLDLLVSVSEW